MLLRVHLVLPWTHSVFTIGIINNSFMYALAQAFLVLPIVAHSCFNLFKINFFSEFFEFLQLVFLKDSKEVFSGHEEQLAICECCHTKLPGYILGFLCFPLNLKQAYVNELF